MSNQAAVLKEEKATLTIEERPIPTPGPSDVVVKNHALATNPVDWKQQQLGIYLEKYPAILGSDVSGVVDAVGSDVKHFKKGDRVTGFADALITHDMQSGAFQHYSVVKECALAKIPNFMTFEEGSILPMSVATSAVGIFLSMGIPRPPAKQQGGFLVWGASSSVGTGAVQIAASLGYTVYGVSSPRHNAMVKKLGAHETFDYNSSSVVEDIIQSLKASNQQIVAAYDAISEVNSLLLLNETFTNGFSTGVPQSVPRFLKHLVGESYVLLSRTLKMPGSQQGWRFRTCLLQEYALIRNLGTGSSMNGWRSL